MSRLRRLKRRFRSVVAAPPGIDGERHLVRSGPNELVAPIHVRGRLELGAWTTLGGHNRSFGDVTVGRYCQIAPFACFYGLDHPASHLTTFVNRSLFEGRLKAHNVERPIVVGNDVWIGHGAVVLRGVTIGDGAVVGAGTVVTRSVGAFEVVGGNPARLLRPRFGPEVGRLLASIRWWELDPEDLLDHEDVFHLDLVADEALALDRLRSWASARSGQP